MGIVLGIYIGTTITSFLLFTISTKAMDERLSREGYKYADMPEKGPAEKTREAILSGMILLMPVINMVLAWASFFGYKKIYQDSLEDGLRDGTIVKKTAEDIQKEELKKEQKKKYKKEVQVVKEEVIINKPYSEMSNEEKLAVLERERAFLLGMNNVQETKSYNDKGAYQKNR